MLHQIGHINLHFIRIAREAGLVRNERQSGAFQCQNEGQNNECVPAGIVNVPLSLVNCIAGEIIILQYGLIILFIVFQ